MASAPDSDASTCLRYADDLAIFSSSQQEAEANRKLVADRLRVAGFALKSGNASSICRLREGDRIVWLGFDVGWKSGQLDVRLPGDAWGRLRDQLMRRDRAGRGGARKVVDRWIGKLGPAFAPEYVHPVLQRLEAELAEVGLDHPRWLRRVPDRLKTAYRAWRQFRHALQYAGDFPLPA